ncbi:suppressor of cytokine signaling 2 isoform X2 [Pseudoliparis swirei]|uniref:suppressor of cytokine signaling 2 isoform X2 n=1 Tax=Pseudoliparis swirei TaxID=2059687 RepID=UPI0024BE5128|nr:suppressor of cytokine signaling 2 isoform X2 [Pseudoliparis swirei]XP_056280490.1 suppressor of cytokine signaling 2 isoform X2 [Pseudoliparis swirei]
MTCQFTEPSDTVQSEERDNRDPGSLETDESRIASAMKDLRTAGWYWGGLTASEATGVLRDASEGTFLLRDSSQTDFLFTISAVTAAGPTNLRVAFKHGKFTLDSVVLARPRLRRFDSVVHLVEHYVLLSRAGDEALPGPPVAAPGGAVQLRLTRPAYAATPPLQHLCRVAINRRTRRVQDLPLPLRLKDYLTDYRYNV